ncbi:DUF6630 family protein [Deinococcus sp.]|uniref:DUF6630 family protein n=1 Tax=Deinococcus sp. TaxID=47478 RepID=UPI003B5CF4B2
MEQLLALILQPLEQERREAISQYWHDTVLSSEEAEGELYLLSQALHDYPEVCPPGWWLGGSFSRWWLRLRVDWKASDEVEWQVQAIARTLHIPEARFVSRVAQQVGAQVPDVLIEASAWLRRRHFELLHSDTQSDEYLAFPIRLDLLRAAFAVMDGLHWKVHLL